MKLKVCCLNSFEGPGQSILLLERIRFSFWKCHSFNNSITVIIYFLGITNTKQDIYCSSRILSQNYKQRNSEWHYSKPYNINSKIWIKKSPQKPKNVIYKQRNNTDNKVRPEVHIKISFPMVRMKWSDKYFTLTAFLTFFGGFSLHVCEGWMWCIVRKSANNRKCAYSLGSFLDLLKRNLHSTFPSINFSAAMSKFSMVSSCLVYLQNYSAWVEMELLRKPCVCLYREP